GPPDRARHRRRASDRPYSRNAPQTTAKPAQIELQSASKAISPMCGLQFGDGFGLSRPVHLSLEAFQSSELKPLQKEEREQKDETDKVDEESQFHSVVHRRILQRGAERPRLLKSSPPRHREVDDGNVDESDDGDHGRDSG